MSSYFSTFGIKNLISSPVSVERRNAFVDDKFEYCSTSYTSSNLRVKFIGVVLIWWELVGVKISPVDDVTVSSECETKSLKQKIKPCYVKNEEVKYL